MSATALRHVLAVASFGFVVLGVACVDLFHSTDFDRRCTTSPEDPACAAEGGSSSGGSMDAAEAAVDGAPPHVDFCAWTSAEARLQSLRACAWLGACERPLGESALGLCAVRAQLAYDCELNPALRPRGDVDAFWSCLANVKSCGDVDDCVFPAGPQTCNAVDSGTSTACGADGNSKVRVECSGPAGRPHGVEPCAMFGRTCIKEDDSTYTCAGVLGFECTTVNGACSNASAIDCTTAGTRSLDRGLDCSGFGAGTCTVGEAGAACVPNKVSTACKFGDTAPTCEGSVIKNCLGGQEIRIDCDKLGLPCDATRATTVDPSAACFESGGSACADNDVCVTPTKLRSCGRGVAVEVDCTSVGLGGCLIDTIGRGACSPPP